MSGQFDTFVLFSKQKIVGQVNLDLARLGRLGELLRRFDWDVVGEGAEHGPAN